MKFQMRQQMAGILAQNGVDPSVMREVGMQARQLRANGQGGPGMRQQLMAQALQRRGVPPQQINNILSQGQAMRQQMRAQMGGGFAQAGAFAGAPPFGGFAQANAFAGVNNFGGGFAQASAFAGGGFAQPNFIGGGSILI